MKKKILLFLMLISIFPSYIKADIDDNGKYITTGDDYEIVNNYDNSHLTFGNNIEVLNHVDGIYLVFGDTVKYSATNDYMALFGNNVTVAGSIKDGAIFGNNVVIDEALIKRDLVIFGNNITINGTFQGNVVIYGRVVKISNSVFEKNLTVNSESLKMTEDTTILKKLIYDEGMNAEIASANINEIVINKDVEQESSNNKVSNYLYSLVKLLVIFLVIYLVMPKFLNNFSNNVSKNFGYGALAFFLLPVILLILLFSNLASSVSLIAIFIYIILVMLAKVICGYILGEFIWKKYIKKEKRTYLIGFMGITILYLISIIPYIGFWVTLASLIYTFGIMINMLVKYRK